MIVESNIKMTLTTEEKNTLAGARDIINDLFNTMQDYSSCYSSDRYTISSSSSFDGDEVSMSDLENMAYVLGGISKSNSLKLEV